MPHDFWVTIHGERGAEWTRVLGTSHLPVRSPVPVRALLPGLGEALVFLLAVEQMRPGEIDQILARLSAKFGLSPEEAQAEFDAAGLPILETDCSVIVHNPQRWLCDD